MKSRLIPPGRPTRGDQYGQPALRYLARLLDRALTNPGARLPARSPVRDRLVREQARARHDADAASCARCPMCIPCVGASLKLSPSRQSGGAMTTSHSRPGESTVLYLTLDGWHATWRKRSAPTELEMVTMTLRKTVWALLTTLTAAALLMSGGTAAAAAPKSAAAAVSCYGSGVNFAKGNTGYYFPIVDSISTTSNCADINLRVGQNTFVKVCFLDKYCQANYTKTTPGQWVVVATNVKDGVRFYFEFYNDAGITGTYAA